MGQEETGRRKGWETNHEDDSKWLRVVDDHFEVIEEKATVVRRVFDLATKEGLVQRAICTVKNQEGHPTTGVAGKNWTKTTVRRILLNSAVMGRYQQYSYDAENPRKRVEQGDPIEEYFPVVVSSDQFHDAQRLRKDALRPVGQEPLPERTLSLLAWFSVATAGAR